VRDLPAEAGGTPEVPRRQHPLAGSQRAPSGVFGEVLPDPLLAAAERAPGRTPSPGLTFDGTGNPVACSGCTPPDTTGDVGPNHYVQMVNATKVAIYAKAGTLLSGPFDLGTLFSTARATATTAIRRFSTTRPRTGGC